MTVLNDNIKNSLDYESIDQRWNHDEQVMKHQGSNFQVTSFIQTSFARSQEKIIYYCPYCTYSTDRKPNIKRHKLTHTGQRPFQCSLCGHKFSMKQSVKRHMRIIHPDAF